MTAPVPPSAGSARTPSSSTKTMASPVDRRRPAPLDLPGGGLDHGEDPRDAALREVEETRPYRSHSGSCSP